MYKYIVKCEQCNREFEFMLKNRIAYKRRFCNDCKIEKRREAGRLGAKTTNFIRSNEEIYNSVKAIIRDEYNVTGRTLTLKEACSLIKMSNKTFTKFSIETGIKFSDIIKELNIMPSGMSKFQKSVLVFTHQIYPDLEIISEKTFDDLINPLTGCKLRVDIYIPSLMLVIECDSKQHDNSEHYFNTVASENGFANCIQTDAIKNEYFSKKSITIVRIPYKRKITKQYILQCLS